MFIARMRLPCQHILQSRSYLYIPLFDVKLVNERWTTDCYQTASVVRFTLPSWNDGNENSDASIISEISSEPKKAILTQVQKY